MAGEIREGKATKKKIEMRENKKKKKKEIQTK